jgi:hypothetical protein
MPSPLRYFVSYAHADKAQAQALMQLLADRLAISSHYRFSAWIDDDIPLGSRWTDEIATALKDCDFGLLLLSPAFFASDCIRRDELPTFIDQVRRPGQGNHTRLLKPVIPVQLKAIPLDGSADLAGLDQLQIFTDAEGRAFHGLRGHLKDRFADQLVSKTVRRLRTLFP